MKKRYCFFPVDTGFLYLHSRDQWTYSQHRRANVWVSGDSSLLLCWGFQKNAGWRSDAQDEMCIPYSLLYPLHNKGISEQETGFIEINRHLPTLFSKCWKVIFVKMAFFKRIVIIILTFKVMFGGLSDIYSSTSLKALSLSVCVCLIWSLREFKKLLLESREAIKHPIVKIA